MTFPSGISFKRHYEIALTKRKTNLQQIRSRHNRETVWLLVSPPALMYFLLRTNDMSIFFIIFTIDLEWHEPSAPMKMYSAQTSNNKHLSISHFRINFRILDETAILEPAKGKEPVWWHSVLGNSRRFQRRIQEGGERRDQGETPQRNRPEWGRQIVRKLSSVNESWLREGRLIAVSVKILFHIFEFSPKCFHWIQWQKILFLKDSWSGTHYLLCERQRLHHCATETQLTEKIAKLIIIHASVDSLNSLNSVNSAPFKENPNFSLESPT